MSNKLKTFSHCLLVIREGYKAVTPYDDLRMARLIDNNAVCVLRLRVTGQIET